MGKYEENAMWNFLYQKEHEKTKSFVFKAQYFSFGDITKYSVTYVTAEKAKLFLLLKRDDFIRYNESVESWNTQRITGLEGLWLCTSHSFALP
jgi:hypothetical protein